jgi:homoaconitase/3-isopropylmalate dehydratase large subunit
VYAKDIILSLIGRFGTDGFIDKAVIFTGPAVARMSLDERMTIANMGIEMGAMITYFSELESAGPVSVSHQVNLQNMAPSVACPSSPGNVTLVDRVAGTEITQVIIGSCTNGRLTDMRVAAEVLAGGRVHPQVTLIVIPASRKVAQEMDDEGITRIIRDAGGVVVSPGCGPCFGAHMGLLCDDDVAVSTTNRNFPGRMGGKRAAVYLASPRTAAESALAGRIVPPGTVAPLKGGCRPA